MASQWKFTIDVVRPLLPQLLSSMFPMMPNASPYHVKTQCFPAFSAGQRPARTLLIQANFTTAGQCQNYLLRSD